MGISLDEIATGAIAILLAGAIQSLLPKKITDLEPLVVLNNPYVRTALMAIVGFYLLSWLLKTTRRRFATDDGGSSAPFVATVRSPPRRDVSTWEVDRFGVKWRVLHGRRRRTGEAYAYADSAVCPKCETDLMTDKKSRRIRDDKRIWKCPKCDFTKGRPSEFLFKEDKAVERIVEQEVRDQSP